MDEFSLTKKIILVTGANGLIGKEISHALASRGADLALLDVCNEKNLQNLKNKIKKKYNIKIETFKCDISNHIQVKSAIKSIVNKFKSIDVLINLAAIDAKIDNPSKNNLNNSFENFSIERWNESMNVNVNGTFIITKQVLKEMIKKKKGNIINVASTYSLVSPNHHLYYSKNEKMAFKPIDYVASKSMIPNFTRYIAAHYGRKGIRANVLIPHAIIDKPNKQFLKNFKKLSPIGRPCDKKELRGPIIFLASDSSSYMNGSTLTIDGGWTAW